MPLVTVARDRIAGLAVGAETCHWGDTKATIWVATSTAAHSGSSTWFNTAATGTTMESGYPSRSANVVQFQGVFTTAMANFQWEMWGIHTATASATGVILNIAAQQALGTKTSAQSWQLTACITFTT